MTLIQSQGQVHKVRFSLGYYRTYLDGQKNPLTGQVERHSSGHYAFSTTETEPRQFCTFVGTKILNGNTVNQVVVHFEDIIQGGSKGVVRIGLDAKGMIETKITFSDVAFTDFGFEIVAVWQSDQIVSNKFYTDSIGLELIER